MNKIEINLHIRPSKDLINKLLTSTIDYLLFSRSQIPFHFELFKRFIENKKPTENDEKKRDWKTEKQLKLAEEAFERICSLKELVVECFGSDATSFMILFGNTIHTAKESYHIILPTINDAIIPTFVNETAEVRKILLRLIQHDDLIAIHKDQLPPTNVFILFKRSSPIDDHPDLNELRNFKLSKSCKKFSIHFRDSTDFEIFDESFQGLSLSEKPSTADDEELWYQSKTYVKGFKDILVNNQSIWN